MSISVEDFLKKYRKERLNIIDIRDNYKYNISHIDGAINIEFNSLISNPNKYLNRNDTYYIYCYNGHNSKYLAHQLNNLGYNIISIDGGYNYYLLIK